MTKLTPELLGAARMLARVDRKALAERAGMPVATLAEFEDGITRLGDAETGCLVEAIGHFGVEILPEGEAGAGVRLKFNSQETAQILGWEGEGGAPAEDEVP